jgi:hypothetical protein
VWTRAYTRMPSRRVCDEVERLAARLGVSRVVVGHTIQDDARINVRCGGQLLMADVGMSGWIQSGLAGLTCSNARGLEIIEPGREPQPVPLPPSRASVGS